MSPSQRIVIGAKNLIPLWDKTWGITERVDEDGTYHIYAFLRECARGKRPGKETLIELTGGDPQ